MTAVVDYGLGNLFSLSSSLKHIGQPCLVTKDADELRRAERIILPGVGAFGDAMEKLTATGLVPVLREQVAAGKPLLGICLGMQVLFEQGEEYGTHTGLGFIPGRVVSMADTFAREGITDLKVPHMGWNALHLTAPCPILKDTREGDCMYFVHSFCATECDEALAATAEYGIAVSATVQNKNVYGCQFHPEKSGEAGLAILRAFCTL